MKKLGLILLLGLVGPLACNKGETESDLSWGHLADQSLVPSSPQYLINKGPSDVYKVCIPQYMVDALPGVEEEVKTAINVWASYLGRTIPVETRIRQVNRAVAATDKLGDMRSNYYTACGNDVDVVLGFAPFGGGTVGQTGSSWWTSGGKITSFQRHLFLRDYTLSPDSWGTQRWISQQELNNQNSNSDDLLNTMEARSTRQVAPKGTAVALQVLVHEFGHVWGLCDQYEGPSNCDAKHSSEHPDVNSMMAAASNVAKIYLTDDDITGVRELAKRDGFNAKWPNTDEAIAKPANAIVLNEMTAFRLNSVEKVGTQYAINFSVVTAKKGGELHFEYRLKGSTGNWQNVSTYFPSNEAFMIPNYTFNLNLRSEGDYEVRLNLRLRGDDGTLGAPVYATL